MNKNIASIYNFYQHIIIKLTRSLLAVFLLCSLIYFISEVRDYRMIVVALNLLVMGEIFYRYGIKTYRGKNIQEVDPLNGSSLEVLGQFAGNKTSDQIIKSLANKSQVRFLLERIPMTIEELPKSTAERSVLLESAKHITLQAGGVVITSMDVIAAHLLEQEDVGHALRSKKLQAGDVIKILIWARSLYPQEESPRRVSVKLHGSGIGAALVTGWTPETANYTRIFTGSSQVALLGRHDEYSKMIESLSKPENNNIILIGEAGAGKEELVSKFVSDSYEKVLPSGLQNKTILELLVGQLLAGVGAQGELEKRLQAIIDEVSHAENVILYVPDFENLLGSQTFSLNLTGALVPYLKNGRMPVIATMTPGNYKTYFESSSLNQLFNSIVLKEPVYDLAETMIMQKVPLIESRQSVIVTYLALHNAVSYADRYFPNEVLPGSAIDLITDALSRLPSHTPKIYYGKTKKLLLNDEILLATIEAKTKIAVTDPSQTEKDTLLHLEEILHRNVIGQDQAVSVISEAMRRMRTGMEKQTKPISFLFLGPTGVGKTQTAKTLANVYFGGEENMIRLDMSEYVTDDGVRRLLGALPGQGDERGELTEKIREHPSCLLLLDEFEKANPAILNLFLQVLEDGRLTDNRGKTVSFLNTIIIATSNAGSEFVYESVKNGDAMKADFSNTLLTYLTQNHLFRPELLNRFDDVVTFSPLTQDQVGKIASLILSQVSKSMQEKDIAVSFDAGIILKIAKEAYNAEYGARPIKRYIKDTIEDLFAQLLLRNEISRGSKILVTLDQNNTIQIKNTV